jgi:hypothetical protein
MLFRRDKKRVSPPDAGRKCGYVVWHRRTRREIPCRVASLTLVYRTDALLQAIVEAFLSELATLGFIGALAFLLTYNFE